MQWLQINRNRWLISLPLQSFKVQLNSCGVKHSFIVYESRNLVICYLLFTCPIIPLGFSTLDSSDYRCFFFPSRHYTKVFFFIAARSNMFCVWDRQSSWKTLSHHSEEKQICKLSLIFIYWINFVAHHSRLLKGASELCVPAPRFLWLSPDFVLFTPVTQSEACY